MTPSLPDPALRRAIDDLFDAALDVPRDLRAQWLLSHCDDARVRGEVEALLRAHDRSGGILDGDAIDHATAATSATADRHIGPYRVLRELGRGGMGVVYLAERADGHYRRRVAVKLLRSSPDAEELHRRFIAERQILASLNHPNIAQLLDGGISDGQLPYLVMEYVDGAPLTSYCDRQRLGIAERLQLFRAVCAAVHHAHQNLIIHRDIKPGNILVTEDRSVKLLDFGIAKLINPVLGPEDQPLTRTEWRVMTPEYASPEQMRGESLTTSSDVYALGVVLYELLCGRRPYRLTSGSAHELAEMIGRRDPDLPSVAVRREDPAAPSDDAESTSSAESIAAARGLSVGAMQAMLRGDLDAIVMMALRKESTRRYGSADLLWEDVQRHLDGLPVIADRGTRWYRARKFISRNRIQVIAAAAVAVSLVTGATVAITQAAEARRERDRAEQALNQSTEVTDFLVRLFRTAAPAGASRDEVTARDLLAAGIERVEDLGGQPLVQAQMLDALGRINEQLGQFEDAERQLRRALDLRRARHGDNHADVAISLGNLATVVRQRGRTPEALQLSREALAIRERVLGPRHPDVAATLSRLAVLTDDDSTAESLYRAARDIQRAAYGNVHLAVAATNVSLAGLLRARGAYDEAEGLLRENLATHERLLGPEHPGTTTAMASLGNFLHVYRHQTSAAESLFSRASGILRRQSPRYLPDLLGVLSGLVGVSADRGDYVQAEAFAREALEAQKRLFGPNHPIVTEGMGMVATQMIGQRRHAEADAVFSEAIALLERTLGLQHMRISRALTSRARARTALGRNGDAEADLRRALAIAEGSLGPTHRWVGGTVALLADVAVRRGKNAEARGLFERASAILRPLQPFLEADMRAAYAALANHYRAENQPGDEAHFRRLAAGEQQGTSAVR